MFKLESYITPILLSYVDKYIKNFRPEDSQVRLLPVSKLCGGKKTGKIIFSYCMVEPEGSTPSVLEPAIRHDPEPFLSTPYSCNLASLDPSLCCHSFWTFYERFYYQNSVCNLCIPRTSSLLHFVEY